MNRPSKLEYQSNMMDNTSNTTKYENSLKIKINTNADQRVKKESMPPSFTFPGFPEQCKIIENNQHCGPTQSLFCINNKATMNNQNNNEYFDTQDNSGVNTDCNFESGSVSGSEFGYESECITNHSEDNDKFNIKNEQTNHIQSNNKTKLRKCDACIEKRCKIQNDGKFSHNNGRVYCGLHNAKCVRLDDIKARNKKPCANHNRKCVNELDIDSKSTRCIDCIEKGREKEKKRLDKRAIARNSENKCWKCDKEYDDPDEFIDERGFPTAKCKECRKKCAIKDRAARAKGTRKTYALSDSTKEKKRLWRENNHDKVTGYYLKHRANKMKNMGDEYWKLAAEQAQKRRSNMSDQERKEMYNKLNGTVGHKLSYYKQRAGKSNIVWNLTDNYATDLFEKNCYYCNCEPGRYRNGIDRLDNDIGYIESNVITSCTMCNIIKGCLDVVVFIKRCEHILTHLKKINGKKWDCTFPNRISMPYAGYRNRAISKNLDFLLTRIEFFTLIQEDCYLCGRSTNANNTNGIDRINSLFGYTMDNVKSCCAECNYMKNKYDFDEFVDKLLSIHNTQEKIFANISQNNYVISNNTLNLYRYSNSTNTFVKSNMCIPMVENGVWSHKYNNDTCFLELHTYIPNDGVLEYETIIFDAGIHKIPFITLSQSFDNTLRIENAKFPTELTNVIVDDLTIIAQIPEEHTKITMSIVKHDGKIKKISFSHEKIHSSCKCDECNNHYILNQTYCFCENCIAHRCHGILAEDLCFWCTGAENNYYQYSIINKYKDDNYSLSCVNNELLGNYYTNNITQPTVKKEFIVIQKSDNSYMGATKTENIHHIKQKNNNCDGTQKNSTTYVKNNNVTKLKKRTTRQDQIDKYNNENWRLERSQKLKNARSDKK